MRRFFRKMLWDEEIWVRDSGRFFGSWGDLGERFEKRLWEGAPEKHFGKILWESFSGRFFQAGALG